MENISIGARDWGQKVVRAATSHGYVQVRERRYSVSPIFCCCCPDDRDGKAGLLVPALLMGIAFFVGLHYTIKSIGQAITYDQWRVEGMNKLPDPEPPPPTGSWIMPALSVPTSEDDSPMPPPPPYSSDGPVLAVPRAVLPAAAPPEPVLPPAELHPDEMVIYKQGIAFLTRMRSERRWTSLGRALLTLGAGALTAAFLVAMIAEGRIGVTHMLYGGAGSMGGGFVVLSGTQCHFRDKRQYEAVKRIQALVYSS